MDKKILLVDDEPNVLQGYKRSLRNKFDIEIAVGPLEGLKAIAEKGPFAVVVSDMQMPEMNGVQFLTQVKAKSPDTVRIMLTGYADQQTAIKAINEGNIFRFLTKPCDPENFGNVLDTGIEHHRLITAERVLLEKTLNGSISLLTEILSLFHPDLFGRSTHIRDLIRKIAVSLNLPSSWEIEVACMLSQIGYLGLPPDILVKAKNADNLSSEEEELLTLVPEIGGHLLANIPRLNVVSNIVLYQNKLFNGCGFPDNSVKGCKIPFGSRILKVISDLIELEESGNTRNQAIKQLQEREGWYDPQVMNKVAAILGNKDEKESAPAKIIISVMAKDLRQGDITKSAIKTLDGTSLLKPGQIISSVQLERIKSCARIRTVVEPVKVERHATPVESVLV